MKYVLVAIYIFSINSYSEETSFKVLYVKGITKLIVKEHENIIQKNMRIKMPFSIATEKDSFVLLKNENMTVRVDEESHLSLSKDDIAEIRLKKGSLLVNHIKTKFIGKYKLKVKTKNVSLGVRGTTFFVLSLADGKSFASVKEGLVEVRGKNSKNYMDVSKGRTVILNKEKKNLQPKRYDFQRHISWNYRNTDKNMVNGEKLISSFEGTWNKYKNQQEYIWKEYNKKQSDSWESWKNSNRRK